MMAEPGRKVEGEEAENVELSAQMTGKGLIRNGVKQLPERYVLRRWRRDVSRAHIRVSVNYAGLVSTPGQLRYDNLCKSFSTLADLVADDENRATSIQKWIDNECKLATIAKSNVVSNVLSSLASQCGPSQETVNGIWNLSSPPTGLESRQGYGCRLESVNAYNFVSFNLMVFGIFASNNFARNCVMEALSSSSQMCPAI